MLDPSSPRTDLCSIDESDLYGEFDPAKLVYGYHFTDPSGAPLGVYKLTIEAIVLKTIVVN